jgi:hypothetical protein
MRTLITTLVLLGGLAAMATPSTLVAIPSTDIQAKGTWHLGLDAYMADDGSSSLTDTGLTVGLSDRIEVGVDLFSPAADPAALNAKLLLSKPGASVPVAAGIYNVGVKSGSSFDQQIAYVVGAKALSSGPRLTVGGFSAKESSVGGDNTGLLLGADYTQGKWWYGADYISGKSALGSTNVGVGYMFADNVGVIVGYDKFNDSALVDTFNVQFDINF